MTIANVCAIAGEYRNEVALLDAVVGTGNGSREHPRMKSLERLFFATPQGYLLIVHSYDFLVVSYLENLDYALIDERLDDPAVDIVSVGP